MHVMLQESYDALCMMFPLSSQKRENYCYRNSLQHFFLAEKRVSLATHSFVIYGANFNSHVVVVRRGDNFHHIALWNVIMHEYACPKN
jgi:hypothetical protein